jgi:hypothetical protein
VAALVSLVTLVSFVMLSVEAALGQRRAAPNKLPSPFLRLSLWKGKYTMWDWDFSSTAEAVIGLLLVAVIVAVAFV